MPYPNRVVANVSAYGAEARPSVRAPVLTPDRRRLYQQRLAARQWLFLLLLHAPLVLVIKSSSLVATAHALITLGIALRCLRFRSPELLVCAMGYIVASEPLWRVGKAMVFYETAKYSIAGLSIMAILRYRTLNRADKSPLLYFALLLPSLLVLPEFDRQAISFNLSGPFALAMCALFLSSLRFPPRVITRLALTTLAPILGFVFLASFSTFTAEQEINFYASKTAAGGLGNNQASSILGLGALLAFIYVFIAPQPRWLRFFVGGLGLWCGVQGALTFSRGGVATGIGAIAAVTFFLLRDRHFRGAVVIRIALIAVIALYIAVPFLNAFTTGSFQDRFTDARLTGRDRIIEADFMAFRENPILGVGPGQSKDYHSRTFRRSSSHTEYSRLLAEHGMLGLFALFLLAWMSVRRLLRRSSHADKAMAAGLTTWAMLFMFHAAMRMAAVSFIFALGSAYLMARVPRPDPSRSRAHPAPPRPVPPRHRPATARPPGLGPAHFRDPRKPEV